MVLSEVQKKAVETINGQIALISCPGSGKTSTVIHRVAYMVEHGISPFSILILTFSKAAATEMKERYLKLMGGKNSQCPMFSTIHAFCFQVLRAAYQVQVKDILRDDEAWMMMRRIINTLRKNKEIKIEIRDHKEFMESCLTEISVINNNGVEWDSYRAQTCETKLFHTIYQMFQEAKQDAGKIDFDDMLLLCRELFIQNKEWLDYYRQQFRYFIIDEYQDTNFLQRDIIYMLAGKSNEANLCIVGDDDQSIYTFRGARPEIMLDFEQEYPECLKIYMDTNYRSEPEIVNAARALIEHNKTRFAKNIKANKSGTGTVEVTKKSSYNEEIRNIIQKIQLMHIQNNVPYEEMAVLYRLNRQAGILSVTLANSGLPFHSNETIISNYTHWMFSDICAYYKLANGFGTASDLMQVINKPNRYIPIKNLRDVLIDEAEVKKAACMNVGEFWKMQEISRQVHGFFQNLKILSDLPIEEFIKKLTSFAGYKAYLYEYTEYRNMDVSELTDILELYISDIKANGLVNYYDWTEYAKSINAKIDQINKQKTQKGITISTMHRAKGLEWDYVFVLGANEGIIPTRKSKTLEEIEEERRVFYVAITRARKHLLISWTDAEKGGNKKCRFLNELKLPTQSDPSGNGNPSVIQFKKGDHIVHAEFGKGIIIKLDRQSITVKFDNEKIMKNFPVKENGLTKTIV